MTVETPTLFDIVADQADPTPLSDPPPEPRLPASIDLMAAAGSLGNGLTRDRDSRTATAAGLPAVIDVETAGRLLGLGRSAAYQLVKDGAWPTPVLRLGRRWRVLTAPLLALLGLDGLELSGAGVTLQTSPTASAIFRHNQGDQQ